MSVDYSVSDSCALITLNRPEQMNSIDVEMTEGLRAALARLEADDTARVAILTGAGERAFCAGMDLKAFARGDGPAILSGPGRFAGFVAAERSKPIIAAVNGVALAGGLELAMACDIVVASSSARFGQPEVLRGIFAGAGGAFRLPRSMSRSMAMELLLTGRIIGADDAFRTGLVSRIVEPSQLLVEARCVAAEIVAAAPLAVTETLRLATQAFDRSEDELWLLNDEGWGRVVASNDAAEGPAAFAERRPARWTGT
jgi:enoyl-CoA hydratase